MKVFASRQTITPIYPYSYNHDDSYTDNYYVKCSYDNKQDVYILLEGTTIAAIHGGRFPKAIISPPLPVSSIIQTPVQISLALLFPFPGMSIRSALDLFFGCFLVGAVLSAVLGGVIAKCLK